MSFEEVRFPTDISYGSTGGPEYLTNVVTAANGYEKRNSVWNYPRSRYKVAHGIKTYKQFQSLISFFRNRRGMAVGFRFKDWSDYKAIGEVIGMGDGTTTSFQLGIIYTSGNVSEYRKITKPVSGSVCIYLDGLLQATGITVDTTTGIITFDTPPTNGSLITADFEFDVPVRFDTDKLTACIDKTNIHSWRNINLVEIRV